MKFVSAALLLSVTQTVLYLASAAGLLPNCNEEQNANYGGEVLIAGHYNMQNTSSDCCASCSSHDTCNVWVFCPDSNGCDNGSGKIYDYQGCTLKSQSNISMPGTLPPTYARGPTIPWTSGMIRSQNVKGHPPIPWLHINGSDIRVGSSKWFVRGVNIPDPRSCGMCSPSTIEELQSAADEVICRMRVAVDTWKVQAFRLAVYTASNQKSPAVDHTYVDALVRIVDAATSLGVYVIVSVQLDPSNDPKNGDTLSKEEIPNSGLVKVWQQLVPAFANNPRVLFGISNEPHCTDGAACENNHDELVRQGMNMVIQAIREAENTSLSPYPHVVLAQGCRNYAANISCYLTNSGLLPDPQVAYEVHMYNAPPVFGNYAAQVFLPAHQLPIVIGEIGPQNAVSNKCEGHMSFSNLQDVLQAAEKERVSYFGWTFHNACSPNMLTSTGCNSCLNDVDNIQPSDDDVNSGMLTCRIEWGCFAYKWFITQGNTTAPGGNYLSCKSLSTFPLAA